MINLGNKKYNTLAEYLKDGESGNVLIEFTNDTYAIHCDDDSSSVSLIYFDEQERFSVISAAHFTTNLTYDYGQSLTVRRIIEFRDEINYLSIVANGVTNLAHKTYVVAYERKEVTLTMQQIREKFKIAEDVMLNIKKEV